MSNSTWSVMPVDPLLDLPGYLLRRASQAWLGDLARRLTPLGLRPAEASVLAVIEANARISQSEVSRLLGIATANLPPLIARLDERGLIERQQVDGRMQHLKLSAKGRTLTKSVLQAMRAHEDELIARVPPHLRKAFSEALSALAKSHRLARNRPTQ